MAKEEKKYKTTEKTKKILTKFFNLILVLYIILLIVYLSLQHLGTSGMTIYEKLSNSNSLTSISTKDALYFRELGILRFKDYLNANDFESAYGMLSEEYKDAFSLDFFRGEMSAVNFESIEMKEIKAKNNHCFEAEIEYLKDGKQLETTYLLFPNELNSQLISISPNAFLCSFKDISKKVKDLELNVSKILVYKDYINADFFLKNTAWFDDLHIVKVALNYDNGYYVENDYDYVLKKGEEKEFKIVFEDTNDFIPNCVTITCNINDDVLRTYTFYFEK